MAAHGGTRSVRRDLQGQRCGVELLHPKGLRGATIVIRHVLALVDSELGEGNGNGEIGLMSVYRCVIEIAQFVKEYICRPAVKNDVVRREEDNMFISSQTDQMNPEQGSVH